MGPNLDQVIVSVGILAEAALLAMLIYRRVYRTLPVFFIYVAWGLASDAAMLILQFHNPKQYIDMFVVEMSIDSALQYVVLVELTWAVLRPFRASLPRGTLAAISIMIFGLGVAAWPVGNLRGFSTLTPTWQFLEHLQTSIAVLRVMFFAILAAGSHLLSMGWRDRELQVATGLGSYSLVSLAGAILHSYQRSAASFHVVDIVVSMSYLLSMVYWTGCFAQKEAPRHEFTPQMQGFLSAVARSAHSQRAVVAQAAGSAVDK